MFGTLVSRLSFREFCSQIVNHNENPPVLLINNYSDKKPQSRRNWQRLMWLNKLNIITLSKFDFDWKTEESGSFWVNKSHHWHLWEAIFEEQSWTNFKGENKSSRQRVLIFWGMLINRPVVTKWLTWTRTSSRKPLNCADTAKNESS